MRISSALIVSLCAAGVSAAPTHEHEQLSFQSTGASAVESLTLGLSSKLSSAFNSVFSHLTAPVATFEEEGKTIWEVINSEEEFKQLAHVLNYSSDATKDIFRKKSDLTFFAPLNWHHHRGEDEQEAFQDLSFGPASVQQWSQIQKQIDDYERDYPVSAIHHDDKDGGKDDEEKKHRRELIRHLIDAHALYHLVRSETALDAKTIADNSSVATWLNTGKSHPNNDGTDWRVRTGKSLLPLPAIYLNFYSRVVKPDIRTAKGGIIHGIKYPLVLPPDVLQSLFFGQTTFSTTTSGLQKVHAAKYLTYRPEHSHHHGHHHGKGGNDFMNAFHHENGSFNGVPAETFFAPTNLAWSRLPFTFRAYLFSPFGYHLLQKVFMLHSLPSDIVYADFVHHVSHSKSAAPVGVNTVEGHANKTSYTFDTVLPAIHGKKGEYETLDVDVYRYYLLPGQKGPLQTRIAVQNVSVILQDGPAGNGVWHAIDRFVRPKGHPEKGLWADVAAAAEEAGYGSVDLYAEEAAGLW